MSDHKKHILIVCHYYPPHTGGIEMVVKNQAERLVKRGHTVTVLTSRLGTRERRQVVGGVQIVRLPALNFLEKRGVPFPIFAPLALARALFREVRRAHIVHIHDAVYMPCVFAAVAARFARRPLVVTQHVAFVQHPSRTVMLAQRILHSAAGWIVYRSAHMVLTLNDRVERHVADHGAASHKLKNGMNGVDTALFHPATTEQKQAARAAYGLSNETPVVLFVGRFVPKKGFDKVLAAQSPNYQLVFAGGEPIQSGDPNLVFVGKLPQEKLAQLYRAADVFVLPSVGEGFPLSVQEAMATGLPIIIAHDDGYDRYRLDGGLVYALPEASNILVRSAITELTSNKAKRSQMGIYSHDYATQNFSWERIVSQLERMYEQISPQKDSS